jgi:hypothetical protein
MNPPALHHRQQVIIVSYRDARPWYWRCEAGRLRIPLTGLPPSTELCHIGDVRSLIAFIRDAKILCLSELCVQKVSKQNFFALHRNMIRGKSYKGHLMHY